MSSYPLQCCLFALALASAGACAASRVGELVVKEGNAGVPCFTIPEAEEARGGAPNFHAITVTEVGVKGALWKMAMPAQRTFPVTFRMCIPYAGRLPVLPQTPAVALQPRRVYEVAIDARARGAGAPRDYRARFCLERQEDGALRVRNLALTHPRQRQSCD
ncbi:MAG: hypothetical protein WKG03_01060 [Telluria sp.]